MAKRRAIERRAVRSQPQSLGRQVLQVRRTRDARELLAGLRKYRGRLPRDFRFDRLEANERR